MTSNVFADWKNYVFRRTDPGIREQIPEKFGEFVYFAREGKFPETTAGGRKVRKSTTSNLSYPIYCRHPADTLDK